MTSSLDVGLGGGDDMVEAFGKQAQTITFHNSLIHHDGSVGFAELREGRKCYTVTTSFTTARTPPGRFPRASEYRIGMGSRSAIDSEMGTFNFARQHAPMVSPHSGH